MLHERLYCDDIYQLRCIEYFEGDGNETSANYRLIIIDSAFLSGQAKYIEKYELL